MPHEITIRVMCGGMRWSLSETDRVEMWRGTTLIGVFTGRMLRLMLESHLLMAEVVGWVQAPPAPPLSVLPVVVPKSLPTPRRPLAKAPPSSVPFTSAERADKATRRRARRKA